MNLDKANYFRSFQMSNRKVDPGMVRVYRAPSLSTKFDHPQPSLEERSFPRFRELPVELRWAIYDLTLPDSRTLSFGPDREITSSRNVSNNDSDDDDELDEMSSEPHESEQNRTNEMTSNRQGDLTPDSKPSKTRCKLPWALLAVNHETRQYAKTKYQLTFENGLSRGSGGVYIDLSRDKLFFMSAPCLDALCGTSAVNAMPTTSDTSHLQLRTLDKVKFLAVEDKLSNALIENLMLFRNLDTLELWSSTKFKFTMKQEAGPFIKKWKKLIYQGMLSEDKVGEKLEVKKAGQEDSGGEKEMVVARAAFPKVKVVSTYSPRRCNRCRR